MTIPDTASGRQSARNQRLIHCLVIGVRTAEIHDTHNTMVDTVVNQLYEALQDYLEEQDSVTISVRNQCLFINSDRLRATPLDYLNVRYLMHRFEDWQIPGICLTREVTKEELRGLLFYLGRTSPEPGTKAPWEDSPTILAGGDFAAAGPRSAENDDSSLRTFAAALDISKGLHEAFSSDEKFRQRSLRRVTQALVDVLLEDENALLAMTSIKNFDGYLFNHCTNVAVLSAALGQRLGLNKTRVGELCLAALLHDLGKTAVSKEVLDKTDPLTEDDWAEIHQHPVYAAEILLKQGYLSPGILAAIVASFEHHMDYDMAGYPEVVRKSNITLFGRIIALADCYDAITTARPYRKVNLTPYDGILFLLDHAGTKFDPVLVKLFVELLGVYPPGTMVRLSNGELAVVTRPPLPGTPLDRPQVRLVGKESTGATLDLSSPDSAGDNVSVAAVVNPDNQGLMPAIDLSNVEVLAG